jgi:hypothetical protein
MADGIFMKSGRPTLRRAIAAPRREAKGFREEIVKGKQQEILGALARRGFRCFPGKQEPLLLLPAVKRCGDEFYRYLKKYSFRLFLRDVIKHRQLFSLDDLLRYCSRRSAEEYLRFLVRAGVVFPLGGSRFRLKNSRISSFGETLEWFVCQILEKEFYLPSLCGFRVKQNRGGGDFDVVALMEGSLIYIETKSSPPKNIEQHDIRTFFDRLEVLAPDLAIYLEDTQLRMTDKIAVMFETELQERIGPSWRRKCPLSRLGREIFGVEDRLFLTNSDPDLITNLGFCLGRYLRSRAGRGELYRAGSTPQRTAWTAPH